MDAMGSALHSVVDATIAYPAGIPTMLDLLSGRIPEVSVDIRERVIPDELLSSDYERDAAARVRFQRWLNAMWLDKDVLLERLLPAPEPAAAAAPEGTAG